MASEILIGKFTVPAAVPAAVLFHSCVGVGIPHLGVVVGLVLGFNPQPLPDH